MGESALVADFLKRIAKDVAKEIAKERAEKLRLHILLEGIARDTLKTERVRVHTRRAL